MIDKEEMSQEEFIKQIDIKLIEFSTSMSKSFDKLELKIDESLKEIEKKLNTKTLFSTSKKKKL